MRPIVLQPARGVAHPRQARSAAVVLALALAGCAPALDWRQVQPDDAGVQALYPCKPRSHERTVRLAGNEVRMRMYACQAQGLTFGITYADLPSPAQVGPALRELRDAASTHLPGVAHALPPLQVPGMTPQPDAAHLRLEARRPDGRPLVQEAAFFARGTRVYQANVVGERLPEEPAQTFFAGLALR